jgi:dTDP-glucose pyrophosphorylase
MNELSKHLVHHHSKAIEALNALNNLGADAILFVVDENQKLMGSLTDGDIRRGLLKGISIEENVKLFIQPNPKFINKSSYSISQIIDFRNKNLKIIPVTDANGVVHKTINFRYLKSYLPLDVVIMAGGRGQRLSPLTDTKPKPLIPVGNKPIIEHNIDRLVSFGVDDIWISVKYLGEQIQAYFGDGKNKGVDINYVWEDEPLGTIGSVSKIKNFNHETILVTNSDLLTNINYEDFYLDFLESGADFSVASTPYVVNVPYAVLETDKLNVTAFREKPTYTYYSNAGIYLFKKSVLDFIPKHTFFNATDLMETLLSQNKNIRTYPIRGYWLDIGNHEDYQKALNDFEHIQF